MWEGRLSLEAHPGVGSNRNFEREDWVTRHKSGSGLTLSYIVFCTARMFYL